MLWQKWNLNQRIRVKLNHEGRVRLLEHHLEERLSMVKGTKSDAEYRIALHSQLQKPVDGWYEFQMHRFIEIFGPLFTSGNVFEREGVDYAVEIMPE